VFHQPPARLYQPLLHVGDTILDPFLGAGSTSVAAAKAGRNSIGFEVDEGYFEMAYTRIANETSSLFSTTNIEVQRMSPKK
jgi:DNA modification methylase